MQPVLDRMAESRKARAATEIALLHLQFWRVARFRAPPDQWPPLGIFILSIVDCKKREHYCPDGHLKDRVVNLPLAHSCGGKRRALFPLLWTARRIRFAKSRPDLRDGC